MSLAVFPTAVDAAVGPHLSFEDQRTDGHYAYVSEITLSHGGWVDVQTTEGTVLWTNRGSAELPYFEPGETYSGWVDLSPALTRNQTLTAVVYNDTDQNRMYDGVVDDVILERGAWMTVQIRSTFDEGVDEWAFVRSTSEAVSDRIRDIQNPEFRPLEGSSGGYIAASDGYDGTMWDGGEAVREWIAPSIYLGDRSNFYGGHLSFDARGTVDWDVCAPGSRYEDRPTLPYEVTFYSGDRELRYRFYTSEYVESGDYTRINWHDSAPGVKWTRYTIPTRAPANTTEIAEGIGSGRWAYYETQNDQRVRDPNELTETTFRAVFSDLDRIEIRGESVNELRGTDCEGPADGEESHLDTVVWNPASSTNGDIDSSGPETTTTADGSDEYDDEPNADSDGVQETSNATTTDQEDGSSNIATTTSTESPGFSAILMAFVFAGLALLTARKRRS